MSTSTGYFPMWGEAKSTDRDVESGLYPGIGETEQMLRLGCVTWVVVHFLSCHSSDSSFEPLQVYP